MLFFPYGEEETACLSRQDPVLGKAILRLGPIERTIVPDPFSALIYSIVSQQIASRAAETVWNRLREKLGGMSPALVSACPASELQSCGMSHRKVDYILGIAEAAASGRVDFSEIRQLPDEMVIRQLSALKGVGVWTAEMLLIFSLCRPDVVSYGDLAIRRGMMNLYGLDALPRPVFASYRKHYAPYGSVASLYLWALSKEKAGGS